MRSDAARPAPFESAIDQLTAELDWLDRRLALHVAGLRRAGRFNDDPLRGLYIGDAEAAALLAGAGPAVADPAMEALALHRAVLDARADDSPDLPLGRVARGFGLDGIDRAALLIAAAPAVDRRYSTLFAYAQNDVGRRLPTPELMLALLLEDREARLAGLVRFTAAAPLRRFGLVTVPEAELARPLADRGLAVAEHLAAVLLGETAVDPMLAGRISALPPGLPDEPLLQARALAALASGAAVVLFEGPADAGQHAAAQAAAAAHGLALLAVSAGISATADDAMHIDVEARLRQAAILIEAAAGEGGGAAMHALAMALAMASGGRPLFISARPGGIDIPALAALVPLAVIRLDPAPVQRRAAWWAAADHAADSVTLARASRLGPMGIAQVMARQPGDLAAAAAAYTGGRLPVIARRVTPAAGWDDLLLPARQRRQLDELAAMQAHWPRVIGDWGFATVTPCPQNCVALFTGPSGTGKTMAAGLVATAGGVPLYRVDLAAVFDKYIGETEKQLDRLFDAADAAAAALLFDEADALFSKRTETRDSHDRYANLSTAYLLQRIEAHDGLVILTSNLPGNIDDAFARRLAAVVAFPMPGVAERRALWMRAFPAAAPLDGDLDLDAIAETFELSGGNIRNIAIAAAYCAASDGVAIGRRHVLGAVARELEKLGRAPIAADFGVLASEF